MTNKLQEMKWKFHEYKNLKLLRWGLRNGHIFPYDDELIEKLRTIYYGGIPASIILLSDGLSNGHCYDRALLMSRAFLDTEDDVRLLYGDVDALKLNPRFISDDPLYADHCFLERTTKEGIKLIYDTSTGFVYDKKLYWLMQRPKIRKINKKEAIKKFIAEDEEFYPENLENDKYAAPMILDNLEYTYGRPNEMYTLLGIELLQREIKIFKEKIDYDKIVDEIDEDMKRMGLKGYYA